MEHHLVDVIGLVLLSHETQRPRLVELCAGCLGNMAAAPVVAAAVTADRQLTPTLLRLWMTCADAPTVSELARLLMGLAALPQTRAVWHRLLGSPEPLNQLLCLAMSAAEP